MMLASWHSLRVPVGVPVRDEGRDFVVTLIRMEVVVVDGDVL